MLVFRWVSGIDKQEKTDVHYRWVVILTPKQIYYILGLQPRDKAATLGVNTIESVFSKNLHENRV